MQWQYRLERTTSPPPQTRWSDAKPRQSTIQEQLRDDYHWTAVAHSETGLGLGRIERRTIQVTPELDRECPWRAFPGVRFATRVVREVIYKNAGEVRSTRVLYLLTGLPSTGHARAPAALVAAVLHD